MKLEHLIRFAMALAVALLLCAPAAMGDDTDKNEGESTATVSGPATDEDRADEDAGARPDDSGVTADDAASQPPRAGMPDHMGRAERLDRQIGDRPERPGHVDRTVIDFPRPDVRPERTERPGVSGLRPN
jgi:hypothetical protein